jgi:hypothetical protein
MRNKRSILSLVITSLLLIAGGIGAYFVHDSFDQYEVKATSSVGSIKKQQETKEVPETKDLKTIIHESQKNVVQLDVETESGKSTGSGFIYNDKGDIVTNAHVVSGAKKITVRTADAHQYEGQLIGIGETTDIAVVRVPDLKGHEFLTVNQEHRADIGDEVIALGSPLGLQNSVTTGIISGLDRDFKLDPYTYTDVYQISAPITKGNSGGPLVNRNNGNVIAINSAGTEEGSIGFSIPIQSVYEQLTAWSENPENVSPSLSEGEGKTETPTLLAKDSKYLVGYFYSSLAIGDYVTAYSLLGSEWQKGITYEDFRKGYLHTIDITIKQIKSEAIEGEDARKVTIIIDALERKENRETKTFVYKCTYTVSYENNQLKILSGKAVKVE